ncbi:hypothetical protein VE02_06047, partial [Pseudogymnoascus sp. 03VT05]
MKATGRRYGRRPPASHAATTPHRTRQCVRPRIEFSSGDQRCTQVLHSSSHPPVVGRKICFSL